MLKMMGWTGGTIGKTGGINEPIVPKGQISHQGLGFLSKKDVSLKRSVDQLLQDYSKTKTTNDLIFSSDFTKKERKDMHQWALKYNLQSVSYGSGKNRRLHVRHKWRVTDLLNLLVEAGGSSDRYELVDKSSCQTS
ncbi:NF-kappa-B-repressing factor [Trichonephila clavata]|uniref:NF-kappa-B-repressing factor n=1 Tax=Trichonephila clavata TaxID=2740835 RepID=A0A8X6KZA2_TRICU|nr:NF-kappa-B-repressing factor [Trichonephila clavata]